jgi:membrane fusion protein, multidrug efflux system
MRGSRAAVVKPKVLGALISADGSSLLGWLKRLNASARNRKWARSVNNGNVFHVPAHPGRTYTAKVARIPNALDQQSRAMMVELDVFNKDGSLAPGMYPMVDWPIGAGETLLFVPATSVVTTTERTFVITQINGKARWVDVQKGPAAGENVSVRGQIAVGQEIVKRASDEIREGTSLR